MKIRAAMLVTALVGFGTSSAQAQFRWHDGPGYYEGLSARAIVRAVRSRGLTPVSRIIRRGDVYWVRAADDDGRVSRVMIDAYSGHIMRIEAVVRRERGPGLPPLNRPRPRYDEDRDHAMRPPRGVLEPHESRDYVARDPRGVPEAPPRVLPADPGEEREFDSPRAERDNVPRETGSLPPPPVPGASRSAVAPAEAMPPMRSAPSRREGARTAAIDRNPPSPRPRPATPRVPQATEAAKPEAPVQAAVPPRPAPERAAPGGQPAGPADAKREQSVDPAKSKSLPRVILPGGPLPKAERTAETRPGQRDDSSTAEAPSVPEEPARQRDGGGSPPAPAGKAPSAMPPVQGLE